MPPSVRKLVCLVDAVACLVDGENRARQDGLKLYGSAELIIYRAPKTFKLFPTTRTHTSRLLLQRFRLPVNPLKRLLTKMSKSGGTGVFLNGHRLLPFVHATIAFP
jgi:hypothetical protein